jgi:hypothetical protein
MSTKIGLRFERSIDTELDGKLKRNGYVIRLTSDVIFRGKSEWIGPYSAIINCVIISEHVPISGFVILHRCLFYPSWELIKSTIFLTPSSKFVMLISNSSHHA